MKLQISPYNTRQEMYREDPWKMLMVCFMLNQTSHKQVDQVREQFFEKYPDAESLVIAENSEIAQLIKPLGFYNKRAKAWKEFCEQWIFQTRIHGGPYLPLDTLSEMKGIGKYALDSWKVFQLYQYDTKVEDHVLNWYVEWAKEEVERLNREGKEFVPMVVYYLHYNDERHASPNYSRLQDYAACVMARTQKEAIEKVNVIALNQKGAAHIKIMGVVNGKLEWVDETAPIKTNEEYYKKRARQVIETRMNLN